MCCEEPDSWVILNCPSQDSSKVKRPQRKSWVKPMAWLRWLRNPQIASQFWIRQANNHAKSGLDNFALSPPLKHFPELYGGLLCATFFHAQYLLICKTPANGHPPKEGGSFTYLPLWQFPYSTRLFGAAASYFPQFPSPICMHTLSYKFEPLPHSPVYHFRFVFQNSLSGSIGVSYL